MTPPRPPLAALEPDLHRHVVGVAGRCTLRNAVDDVARGNRYGAGIEYIVSLGAGTCAFASQPSVDIADTLPLEQLAATLKSNLGFLRRQRHACVQPQEHQFGMCLANIARAIGADERI